MPSIAAVIAGSLLGLLLVVFARRKPVRKELRIYAIGLAVAALIYVVFAAIEASPLALLLEVAGLAAFGALSVLGVARATEFLALGWALHTGWDVILHVGATSGAVYTPVWYPWLCVGFDLVVAGGVLFSKRNA